MADFIIQGGTVRKSETTWEYRTTDREGEHVYIFTSEPNEIPKVGDRVENDVLVVTTEPVSNQDHSRWERPDYEVWGRE